MYHKETHPFYLSVKWRQCRKMYMRMRHYVCERCGKPADVVHHKDPLRGVDYYDNPDKCFGLWNLLCLCHNCHNEIHKSKQSIADGYKVDMVTGEIEAVPPVGEGDSVGK